MPNFNLNEAKRAKNDEFYTQLPDIERELAHYPDAFRGKTVYCNCDDPTVSNFFVYFAHRFRALGLKRLVTTCYRNSKSGDMFSDHEDTRGLKLEYDGRLKRGKRVPSVEDIGVSEFRSQECVDILKEADVVVTNPPFSLFRQYIAQLVEHGKEFLILGNMNASTYKEVFPLFKTNKLWMGPSITSGDREFGVPEHYPLNAATSRVDEAGNKYIRVKGVRWFTNLDHQRRHEPLILWKRYTPEEYPTYDNYDAIDVGKVAHIPKDYDGPIGVPISYLDKHCPDQFDIVGIDDTLTREATGKANRFYVSNKRKYARIVIRARRKRGTKRRTRSQHES